MAEQQFDQQQAQDLLSAAIQQRDSAMNSVLQVQAVIMAKDRQIADLDKQISALTADTKKPQKK